MHCNYNNNIATAKNYGGITVSFASVLIDYGQLQYKFEHNMQIQITDLPIY